MPAARSDRVADRVDRADAGPALLADAGVVGGEQHPAARLEVRAVGDGDRQPRRDRPDRAEGDRLGERVRVLREERLERVGQRVDAGGGGRLGRQPERQLRVEDRELRQDALVADVALPPDRLVGDHAVGVRLGAGAGGRRDRDHRQTRLDRFIVVAK